MFSLVGWWFEVLLLFLLVVEVMKVLRAKNYAKSKKQQPETVEKSETETAPDENQCSSCEEEGKSDKKKYKVRLRKQLSSCFILCSFVFSIGSYQRVFLDRQSLKVNRL